MPAPATVDDYIAAQPAPVQPRLRELRRIIRAAVPEATEVISYGIPTYKFGGGMVSFGAAKRHCALYGSAMAAFPEELRGYDTSKGTVRFPLDQPIPDELVRKLVMAKVAGQGAASK
ncbi:MAG: iron chaperone [Chloroflexota bacterium]